MKLNKLSVAVSSLLVSGAVYAHGPSISPDLSIYMSGASAQDKAITALFTDLCVAGTLDTYKDSAKSGKNYTNYFCTIDSTKVSGLSITNPKVLFSKRSAGGSAQGVAPVLTESAIDFMGISDAASGGNCSDNGDSTWSCNASGAGLVAVIPDAGVSDVNPEMFTGPNTPAGYTDVDANAVANKLTVVGAAGLVFGVPVNNPLYAALQEAQFGSTHACIVGDDGKMGDVSTLWDGDALNDDADAADNYKYTEACMPSLSKRQIASIYAGQVETWDDFLVGSTSFTAAVSAGLAPDAPEVAICRRVNGSGTQAQANALFLNSPCTVGALAPAESSGPFGPIVELNSGSSNVEVCLNDFSRRTGDQVAGNTSRYWAVGVQSTEKNASATNDYRYIKVDGVAPTLENAWNGKYLQWVEQTFQWRKAGGLALAGDKKTIVEKIASDASNPTTLATNSKLNPAFNHPFGQAGYLALVTNGHTPDASAFNASNPVIGYSHVANSTLDNCRTPVMFLDPAIGTVDSQL